MSACHNLIAGNSKNLLPILLPGLLVGLQLSQLLPLLVGDLLEVETPEDGDDLVDGVGLVEGGAGDLEGRAPGRGEGTLCLVSCSLGTGRTTERPAALGAPAGREVSLG